MRITIAGIAVLALASFTACGGGGSAVRTVPVATPIASTKLPAASTSVCVPAQTTPQTVTLPDTGGVNAVLTLAQYDAGSTGCQNITIATGSAITGATTLQTQRKASAAASVAAPVPLIQITVGQGLSSSTGVATVLSGATLQTDPNVVFPNGTYNATIVFSVLGTSPITQSLIFTATNRKLVITSGDALPARIPAGAQLSIYDRGVIPPDFNLATPAPSPSASPTTQTTPSPVPSLTPAPSPSPTANNGAYGNPPPPAGQPIGTQSYTTLDGCPTGYLYTGYACSATSPILSNGGSDIQLFGFPAPGNNGQVYYVINNFSAVTYTIIGCDPPVQYSGGGASGTFTIPADTNPEWAHNSHVCAIELSTLPIGATGEYYSVTLDLFGGGFHANAPTSGPFPVTTPSPGAKSSIRRTAR